MFTLNSLLEALNGFLFDQHMPLAVTKPFCYYHILEGASANDSSVLYIGTPGSFVQTADSEHAPGCTFVLAGSSPALTPYLSHGDMNLLITSLSLPALCNLVISLSASYDSWINQLNEAMYVSPNLLSLIDCGAKKIGGDAYLLDANYRLLCANSAVQAAHPLLLELREKEFLAFEHMQTLQSLFPADEAAGWAGLPDSVEPLSLRLFSVVHNASVVGHLLLILPGTPVTATASELAAYFFSLVEQFLLKFNHEKYKSSSDLNSLVADLIEGRLQESEELVSRLKQLPLTMKKYYHCVVVELPAYANPSQIAHMSGELEEIFAGSTVATYQNDIVILAWKSRHYQGVAFDRQAMTRFLEQNDAFACIGNLTRWLNSLRPIFRQTKGGIKHGKAFRSDPDCRLFFYEEYSMYQIVEMCIEHGQEYYGGDLVYLCHPGIITLVNYDRMHNANLSEVLKVYLMNDRNLTQTARDLFFHRNTMQNKIDKIKQIVDVDLELPLIRQRLLFSFRVLEYLDQHMNFTDVYAKRRNIPATSELIMQNPK